MSDKINSRIRIAGIAMLLGIIIDLASLFWHGPTAFLVLVGGGAMFLLVGIVFYLLGVVGQSAQNAS